MAFGTMWFEGSLWKLPIASGGFQYWLEQETQLVAMLFAAQLYFGLYTHPHEWPWEFIFIIMIAGLFYLYAAARNWA